MKSKPTSHQYPAAAALASVAILLGAFAPVAFAPAAQAGEIYHWVDADGRVHYSDAKPLDETPHSVLEIESEPAADYDPVDDPYSILNQAARIHEVWLDLEEARQARVRERNEARAANPPQQRAPYEAGYDYTGYGYTAYGYYPAWPVPAPDYRPGKGREQIHALQTLDLLGPGPQSINSGVHQDRVERSQYLPIVPPPAPPPRPTPR